MTGSLGSWNKEEGRTDASDRGSFSPLDIDKRCTLSATIQLAKSTDSRAPGSATAAWGFGFTVACRLCFFGVQFLLFTDEMARRV